MRELGWKGFHPLECWDRRAPSTSEAKLPFYFVLLFQGIPGTPGPKGNKVSANLPGRSQAEILGWEWDKSLLSSGSSSLILSCFIPFHPHSLLPVAAGAPSRENSRKSMELSLLSLPGISVLAKQIRNCVVWCPRSE